MSGPLLNAEAFAELQLRARRRGVKLTRSESDGVVRVFANGRELDTIDDLESVLIGSRAARPLSDLDQANADYERRIFSAQMLLGAAVTAGERDGRRAPVPGQNVLRSIQTMNAAGHAIDQAKSRP